MQIVLIIFIVFVLIFHFIFKNKIINSSYLNFFKFLFPSWNFFDGCSETPFLFFKLDEEWIALYSPKPTRFYHLIYNPDHNLYLAFHSHVLSLMDEIYIRQDEPNFKIEDSTIYLLTINWIQYRIKELFPKNNYKTFQFKLSDRESDILISPRYDL